MKRALAHPPRRALTKVLIILLKNTIFCKAFHEKSLFFTFVGTWVSAATILGFTGNVYHSGLSVIASSVIPWFIGAGLLYLMTDRLYENDVLSIPQLIGKKHDSKFLQTASAIFMICGYIFYLMIQIKGFGIAVSSLLNINY